MQVADALQPYGDVLGLKMKVVCGGTSMGNQIYALERGVDVLVATPGRLRDIINRGACSLANVQVAVLDEADQMSDLGFLPEVTELLDQIPGGGQRMLFSATHGERDLHAGQALPDRPGHARGRQRPGQRHDDVPPHPHREAQGQGAGHRRDRLPQGPHDHLRPHPAGRRPHRRAALRVRCEGRRAARRHDAGRSYPRPRGLQEGLRQRPGRHRRRRPRHPRRRHRPGPERGPGRRPQGLPAPLRPYGPRRPLRHGRLAVPAAPAPPDLPPDGGRGRRRLAPHHPGRRGASSPRSPRSPAPGR